ncbi:hypothetical protein MJO28_012806 [Puccinia striiformis f. sp. tritici]|uniref:Uncharacterized protein n=1 Tax=Puccinia striiformis f. sp. tritici TaxID=168172 RepID=A0ACC0DWQ6_9BASI|nr:hypothetical protein MJO28_012806 [Puccinia striiformis f. sp. tritici]
MSGFYLGTGDGITRSQSKLYLTFQSIKDDHIFGYGDDHQSPSLDGSSRSLSTFFLVLLWTLFAFHTLSEEERDNDLKVMDRGRSGFLAWFLFGCDLRKSGCALKRSACALNSLLEENEVTLWLRTELDGDIEGERGRIYSQGSRAAHAYKVVACPMIGCGLGLSSALSTSAAAVTYE